MNQGYRDTLLKGGSLNKTVLRTFDDGRQIVRKSVDRNGSREYGFVRWYSQFKRLQRYDTIFPGLFPELLDAGVEGPDAYLDMDYIAGSVNLKDYLTGPNSTPDVPKLLERLFEAADRLHGYASFTSYRASLQLYFAEEVLQRLNDALAVPAFRAFCDQPEVVINGQAYPTLLSNLDWLSSAFSGLAPGSECYTHGNMTLENILYVPSSERIWFVDPYEENVVDCREAEYSQVLQCSKQHYGFINDRSVEVRGATVSFATDIPEALIRFNDQFEAALALRLTPSQLRLTRFLEASQFTRMLPFKLATGDIDKAVYFYCVASRLVQQLREDDR